jgi:hypothetical protein
MSNFCVQKSERFICDLGDGDGEGKCELGNFKTLNKYYSKIENFIKGKFLRIKNNNKGQAFSSSLEFKTPIESTQGNYTIKMSTLINCGSAVCGTAGDKISIKIKDGDSEDFKEVKTIEGRFMDEEWKQDEIIFSILNHKFYVNA